MIPIAKPLLGPDELRAVRVPILSGWVTQGPEVAAFEEEFKHYTGAAHACAVSNCTAALFLALKAAGVRRGGEVITVSHSFIATANSVRYLDAVPVFADIDAGTYNIDPSRIAKLVTRKTQAVLAVHQMGMPCDLELLARFCRAKKLPLVEDAACAVGSRVKVRGKWQKIGLPHGDVACFSFHPRKILTTGDGGMLTTRHANWDRAFRLWRQHGMSVPDTVRHSAAKVTIESYGTLGYNYRMTDLQASIGRTQLARLDKTVDERRALARRYREGLKDVPGLTLPSETAYARSNWQSFCVRLPQQAEQSAVMQRLLDSGVASRRGIMCAHREPAYRARGSYRAGGLVESERAQDRCILIPLYNGMKKTDQDTVIRVLRGALAQ